MSKTALRLHSAAGADGGSRSLLVQSELESKSAPYASIAGVDASGAMASTVKP